MGFLNQENAKARLESGFWDNSPDEIVIETQELEYSDNPCDFDECPFKALIDGYFCETHQREWENMQAGRQPDEDQ